MKKSTNFFKISLIYFISLVLFVGLRIVFQLGFLSGIDERLQDILSTVIIQIGIMFFVPLLFYFLIYKQKPKETFSSLGFKKISTRAIVISFFFMRKPLSSEN